MELNHVPRRSLNTWQPLVKPAALLIHPTNGNPFYECEYCRNSNCIVTFSFQHAAVYSVKQGALDVHFHTLPSEPRNQSQYISLPYNSFSNFFMATGCCHNQSDYQVCGWAAVYSVRGCSGLSSCCLLSRPFLDRCVWWTMLTRSSSCPPDDVTRSEHTEERFHYSTIGEHCFYLSSVNH